LKFISQEIRIVDSSNIYNTSHSSILCSRRYLYVREFE